jgi:hypothetical protein
MKTKKILFCLILYLFLFQKTQAAHKYATSISSNRNVHGSVIENYSNLEVNSISSKLNLAYTVVLSDATIFIGSEAYSNKNETITECNCSTTSLLNYFFSSYSNNYINYT